MKVTVCELPDATRSFDSQWSALVRHAGESGAQIVLLPDMPFFRWLAAGRGFDAALWMAAVRAHEEWEQRLAELAPAAVLASRPVDFGNDRYDEGYVWDRDQGFRSAHAKSSLPDEEHAWEGSWYHSAAPEFTPIEAQSASVGFLMGTELWREDEAHRFRGEHVDLLACPRSGGTIAPADWLNQGRGMCRLARAYGLASNRSGSFGGQGWIISPEGEILGTTSAHRPFLTLDIPLSRKELRRYDPEVSGPPLDPLDSGVPPYP
jgi:N-carbamoylputrescine amidase